MLLDFSIKLATCGIPKPADPGNRARQGGSTGRGPTSWPDVT